MKRLILLAAILGLGLPPATAVAERPVSGTEPADAAAQAEPVRLGGTVPDFRVTDLDGKELRFNDLRGDRRRSESGVTVLMFWCSFCHSCRHVEGDLDRLAKAYRGKAAVFALDASAGETPQAVSDALREGGLSVPVVLDPSGHTADLFGTERTTTTVVIDAQGVLRYRGQFARDGRPLAEEALQALLDGREVPVTETPHRG